MSAKKPFNLTPISNCTNLNDLSKHDDLIRRYAVKTIRDIVKTTDDATIDNIVQEVYLKAHTLFEKGTVIDGGLIYLMIKQLFINHMKYESRYNLGTEGGEALIPDQVDTTKEDIELKEYREELFHEMEERVSKLHWYDKAILDLQNEMSLLELSRQSKITYRSLIYSNEKINIKLGIEPKKNKKK